MTTLSPAKAAKRTKRAAGSGSSGLPLSRSRQIFDRRSLFLSAALFAAVLVSYSPIIHNGFLDYDDGVYITDNPHVRAGMTWATVEWAFTAYDAANWHPLTWLSHALDCTLFG